MLLGSVVPWVKSAGQPGVSLFGGFPGVQFSDNFWGAAEPAGVILASVILSIVLLARGRSGYVAGLLTAFGIQTMLLFSYYAFAGAAPSTHEAGGPLGLVGGAVLLAAGLIARAAKDGPPRAAVGGVQAHGAVSPGPR